MHLRLCAVIVLSLALCSLAACRSQSGTPYPPGQALPDAERQALAAEAPSGAYVDPAYQFYAVYPGAAPTVSREQTRIGGDLWEVAVHESSVQTSSLKVSMIGRVPSSRPYEMTAEDANMMVTGMATTLLQALGPGATTVSQTLSTDADGVLTLEGTYRYAEGQFEARARIRAIAPGLCSALAMYPADDNARTRVANRFIESVHCIGGQGGG